MSILRRAGALEEVDQHPVVQLKAAGERLRCLLDELAIDLLVPGHIALLGRLLLDDLALFFGVAERPRLRALVLDDVLGSLTDHPPSIVETLAARAPGDLVEVAHGQEARLLAVELAELREQDGPQRDVDAHAQGVGPADDLQQAALGETLDEQAILREQARVVEREPRADEALHVFAVRRIEAEPSQRFADGGLVLFGGDVEAREVLHALGAVTLGEAHHVDRGAGPRDQGDDGLVQGLLAVLELQGDGAGDGAHEADLTPGPLLEPQAQLAGVSEGGRHEHERRSRQREQRDLPRHAPLPITVEVKLVEDGVVDLGAFTFAEGHRREDLRGAADHRRVPVDGRVPGHHADVLPAERAAELEELLADEGLDRRGVKRATTRREGLEMHRQGHERLAGAGRRIQDDVPIGEDLEDGLLLVRVERQPRVFGPVHEDVEQGVDVARQLGRQSFD